MESLESKIFKALDGLEAVIAHNESQISTWLPNEYDLQLTYAYDKVSFSEYLTDLRDAVKQETVEKIKKSTFEGS